MKRAPIRFPALRYVSLGLVLWPLSAIPSWLSEITNTLGVPNVDVNSRTISFPKPQPQQLPQVLSNAVRTAPAAFQSAVMATIDPTGEAFAEAIRNARSQSRDSAQPIPANLRLLLQPFFPAKILDQARWTVYDASGLSLPKLIEEFNSNVAAVTVDDVIVFKDQETALNNYSTWAHELTHVSQYQNMGVDSFAHLYLITGGDSLEKPAYAYQDTVTHAIQQTLSSGTPTAENQAVWQGDASTIGVGNPVTRNDFVRAGMTAIPAERCIQPLTGQDTSWLKNVCAVPVYITGFSQPDLSGVVQHYPCVNSAATHCYIQAGEEGPAVTPNGTQIISIEYSFIQSAQTQPTPVGQPEFPQGPSIGHSCCTQVGRCGPFMNFPMQVGTPGCYCSTPQGPVYGNVCMP